MAFAHLLYRQGVEQSRRPAPVSHVSLLSWHAAVEVFLAATATRVGTAPVGPEAGLATYAEALGLGLGDATPGPGSGPVSGSGSGSASGPGRQPSLLGAIGRLDDACARLKREGVPPEPAVIERARADVAAFLDESTAQVFHVAFSDFDQENLTEAHERAADPEAADGAGAARDSAPADALPPTQLPRFLADFTGRDANAQAVVAHLVAATARSTTGVVSAVAGIGGVGKTTLAVHVAHAAREAFPDGQLYVDLQGTEPRPADPDTVLAAFLRALGVPNQAIPETLAERAALYRSTLDGRRVLTLLDNAYDAAQVRPLLPGTPGCAALITSRVRMVDLAGAHLVDLDVMSPGEALHLFTRIVGDDRVAGERQAALDVVGACGFLPLAIRIAAARLAARRTWTVSALARKLADQRRRLDELRAGDLAVKATFALGYGHLSPDQARAFRLLSLADGPDISLDAAAAVLDLDPYATEELLEALVDISLIESAAPARYRYHDLLRLYARECAEADETPDARCGALSRLLDFYLATAACAYELENPGDRMLDHLAPTTRTGLAFATRDEALEWMFSEAQGLLAAVQQTAADGCDDRVRRGVDLLLAAQDVMESGIYARQFQHAAEVLAAAARKSGDSWVEARARIEVAQHLCRAGRFEEAESEAQRALLLGTAAADPLTCGYAPNVRGIIALHTRRFEESTEYFGAALQAFQSDGSLYGEAATLSNLSRAQIELGRTEEALHASQKVVDIYRDLGAGFRLANGLYGMAIALAAVGRLDEALARLTEALLIFRDARQRFWEGMTLYRIAGVHQAAGRWRQSVFCGEQALDSLREFGGDWRTANALTMMGRAWSALEQTAPAHGYWSEALDIYNRINAESPEAREVHRLLAGIGGQ